MGPHLFSVSAVPQGTQAVSRGWFSSTLFAQAEPCPLHLQTIMRELRFPQMQVPGQSLQSLVHGPAVGGGVQAARPWKAPGYC